MSFLQQVILAISRNVSLVGVEVLLVNMMMYTWRIFSLWLEEYAREWYINLADDSYNTWDSFRKGFMEIFGEKKEPRFLLNALQSIKRNENETME